MDALPNTAGGAPTYSGAPLGPGLTRRQENYARCVASGLSYAEAFRQAGCVASTAGSRSNQIALLNRTPHVAARVRELRGKADDATAEHIAERMSWLRLIVGADPAELSKVVHDPCGSCWLDEDIAAAYAAHFAPNPFDSDEPRPALPDVTKPRHDCKYCMGAGIARVVITPTDELSPGGRALFKSASQNDKGVITLQLQDQSAAADMLNKLQSAYVQRSMNLNLNASVLAARDVSTDEATQLFEAFGK